LAVVLFARANLPAKAQISSDEAPSTVAVEERHALVIGQSDYRDARLITGTADAARMAEALAAAGFAIESGADLEQHLIREKIRRLEEKARQSGGEATIFVYVCGRVAQINGENILLPVGSPIERATDVLLNGFRLNDLVNTLKLIPANARVIVVDASPPPPQLVSDRNFNPGLAILEAPEGFLIAFNQNPGRPLPEPQPPMGQFIRALLDAMQQPVGSFGDFFAFARQRVFEESYNHQMPWDDDKLITSSYPFFRPKDGTALVSLVQKGGEKAQLSSMSRDQAFQKIIASDSIADYQSFLVEFPRDEAVPTVQYNLAVRREAEVWARAAKMNTAEGYWTYIQAYPDGGNVEVARDRLAMLGANPAAPPVFVPVVFGDLPPPLASGELIASSASLPVEFIPRPPSLSLPPVTSAIAALAAIPVANAVGQQLPRANIPSMRPNWAAAHDFVRPGQGPSGSGPPLSGRSYQPLAPQATKVPSLPGAQPSLGGYKPITPSAASQSQPIRPVPLERPNVPSAALGRTQQLPTSGLPSPQSRAPTLVQPGHPTQAPTLVQPGHPSQAPAFMPPGHAFRAPAFVRPMGGLQAHIIGPHGHAAPVLRRR
jgi:hypothetical protein